MAAKKIFTILSGPSCVGKGPLVAALDHFHPDIKYAQIPVIKSKESRPKGPRPEEVGVWSNPDFFRSSHELLELDQNPQFLVGDCRGLPQAVDLDKVDKQAQRHIHEVHLTGDQLMRLSDEELAAAADRVQAQMAQIAAEIRQEVARKALPEKRS